MAIEKITNHTEAALKRLLGQFKDKEVIKKVLTILVDRMQAMENVTFDLVAGRDVLTAVGKTLELIGERSNMPRPESGLAATDDEAYRLLILAKIVANNSENTREDLIAILKVLGATDIYLRDIYPASTIVNHRGIDPALISNQSIYDIIKEAIAPITFQVSSFTATPFGFAGNPKAFPFGQGSLGSSI